MTMDIEPRHAFLMAVKYEFPSKSIKTGSFIYVNISKKELELRVGEKNDKCLPSVDRNQSNKITVDKPFVCGTCHKGFRLKGKLKTHQRIHTGEKPFKCKTYHKRFTEKGHMTKHQRIRIGDKLYECKICHTKFTYSTHLTL